MGQLRTPTPSDLAAFPGCTQIAFGTIPLPQCTQALESGYNATTTVATLSLKPFVNPGWAIGQHNGKTVFFQNPDTGSWEVATVTITDPDELLLSAVPWDKTGVHWYIDDGPGYEEQQDANSFMDDAVKAGHSATMKGAQVFTNTPLAPRNEVCYILSNPS